MFRKEYAILFDIVHIGKTLNPPLTSDIRMDTELSGFLKMKKSVLWEGG